MRKILIYNWLPFDNPENAGGGVNVYCKNLVRELTKTNYDVTFLSCGYKYSPFTTTPFIKETTVSNSVIKTFEIINSPVMAPAYTMYNRVVDYYDDTTTVSLFEKFILDQGPFDIIHFQNLEGISPKVLSLKEKFNTTKFIFSIHNYLPICPLVQLFKNHKNIICRNYENGNECTKCLCFDLNEARLYKNGVKRYINDIYKTNLIRKPVYLLFKTILCKRSFRKFRQLGSEFDRSTPEQFSEFRTTFVSYINKYCDTVLAVSKRVKDILISYGMDKNKIHVSYIGTKVAEKQIGERRPTSPFCIAYLGQPRIDKGFFFFIDCLKKINKDIAQNINIVLAVKDINEKSVRSELKSFNKVIVYNGYSHNQLQMILSPVHLGVIPVIWEDNLPQVAIEMVANGVPILCSDAGGASELCDSDIFKFKCNDNNEFISKLEMLYRDPNLLHEYWSHHNGLVTMTEHIKELKKFYE